MIDVTMTINGKPVHAYVDSNTRLLDFLREDQGLTGTKEGCSVGECGACTVIVNARAVCSCLMLVAQCQNADIVTIESMREDPLGAKLQDAFVRYGGVQCGFCTPGVLMSTKALLTQTPHPSDDQIREALEGNLCRCTGYLPIINSIKAVLAE